MNDLAIPMHGPRRAAPPGGAERAIAAGRRRIHRRRAAGTAGALSLAAVGGAALAQRPGGRAGLAPTAPIATASGTASPRPTPSALGPLPTPGVPVPEPRDLVAGPTGEPGPSDEPTAAPTDEPAPSDERRFIGRTDGQVRTAMKNDPAACSAVPAQASFTAESGFCTILDVPETVTPGTPVALAVSLCRPAGMEPRTVTYEDGYEVAIDVAEGTVEGELRRWAWADREDFGPAKHTVTFNGGDCRTWTVTWAGQDDDGYALASGEYQVNGYPLAYDWTHEDGDDAMGPAPVFYTVRVT